MNHWKNQLPFLLIFQTGMLFQLFKVCCIIHHPYLADHSWDKYNKSNNLNHVKSRHLPLGQNRGRENKAQIPNFIIILLAKGCVKGHVQKGNV